MIDNVTLFARGSFLEELQLQGTIRYADWNGIQLDARFKGGLIECYEGRLRNLMIRVTANGMMITGSLHTFQKGSNHTQLTYGELLAAITTLQKLIGIPANTLKVLRLEFGLNLSWHEPVGHLLKHLYYYRGAPFDRMLAGSKAYGLKRRLSKYNLKIYDKAYQIASKSRGAIKLSTPLLRIEIQYLSQRRMPSDKPLYLSDLTKREQLQRLGDDLGQAVSSIAIGDDHIDFYALTVAEAKLLVIGRYPDFWDAYRLKTKEAAKAARRKYLRLLKRAFPDQAGVLKDRLEACYRELMAVEPYHNPTVAEGVTFLPCEMNVGTSSSLGFRAGNVNWDVRPFETEVMGYP